MTEDAQVPYPDLPDLDAAREQILQDLIEQEQEIEAYYRQEARKDFLAFIRGLKIDNKTPDGVLFHRVIRSHQVRAFEDLAPNLHSLARGDMPACKRFWWERTKKASKDADLSLIVAWLVAFPQRPFYGQIGAADRDQAAIVKSRLSVILELNPWLNDLIKIVGNQIRSTAQRANGDAMAVFDIMAADASGSHGGTPDLLIVNELSHIQKWAFATTLMSNAAGVPNGIAIIATNAGVRGSEAHVWRQKILASKKWNVHILDRPAPWHNKESVEDEKSLLSPSQYNRLWRGKWVSGKGDALDDAQVRGLFRLKGPASGPEEGWVYFGGIDLGVSRDHSGWVILGASIAEKRIKMVHMHRWDPKEGKDGKIWLPSVREHIIITGRQFGIQAVTYDPHQAELMMQDVSPYFRTNPMPFTATNCQLMANTFVQAVEKGHLDLFDDEDGRMESDIGRFSIVEKNYGLKLEATRDASGHADVGTALVIVLPVATRVMRGYAWNSNDTIGDQSDGDPLSKNEILAMPRELREIYEMGDADNEDPRLALLLQDAMEEKDDGPSDLENFESLFDLD